jgi:hypothetical protein
MSPKYEETPGDAMGMAADNTITEVKPQYGAVQAPLSQPASQKQGQ